MLERRTQSVRVADDRRRPGHDRRATPRYAAKGTRALFTWMKGEGYAAIEIRLRDISQGGLSAFAEAALPADTPLWFRLCADETSAWIGVSIVGVCRTGLLGTGPRLVRARFHDPCPYELFKAAIGGLLHGQGDEEYARGGLRDRDGFR